MIQIVMARDVRAGPEAIVALVQVSNRNARLFPRGDPR